MAANNRRAALLGALCLATRFTMAQVGSTFAYTGEDALPVGGRAHWVLSGGLSNSVLMDKEVATWAWLPAIMAEGSYLLLEGERSMNLSVGVAPELFLHPWLMARITLAADMRIGSEAKAMGQKGLGATIGLGYAALGSTFNYQQHVPVARLGVRLDRFRLSYAVNIDGPDAALDHQVAFAVVMEL